MITWKPPNDCLTTTWRPPDNCLNILIKPECFAYSDEEDDIVGQDVNVQQHRVINDDILEEEESESITSVKMATWLIVISFKKCHRRKNS